MKPSAVDSADSPRGVRSGKKAVMIGLVASLSLGFLDIAKNLAIGADRAEFFTFFLSPLVATACVVFVAYLIAWFLVAAPVGRFLKLAAVPLAVALTCFTWLLFLLMNILGFSLDPRMLPRYLSCLTIAVLASTGGYFVARAIAGSVRVSTIAVAFFLALPFLLAEAFLLAWLHTQRGGEFLSMISLLVTVGFLLIAILTFALFYRTRHTALPRALLAGFALVVVLSPLVVLLNIQIQKHRAQQLSAGDHKIRHVILVTIDTLRRDVLSCYGSKNVSTPRIDRLAGESIVFNRAIAPSPWTLPSVASMMTGLSPAVHKTIRPASTLPETLPTLAENMRSSRYHTTALIANGILERRRNISQGFNEYRVFAIGQHGGTFGEKILLNLFPGKFLTHTTTRDLTHMSIDWLESNLDKDFFLWIHYLDPHLPYEPPADFLPKTQRPPGMTAKFRHRTSQRISLDVAASAAQRAWIRALYNSEVRYIDEFVGGLVDALKRIGLYDQSLIVLTSDHGEEFWEHGGFEHGHTLYNELIEVPLMIKLPGSESTAQESTLVSIESIMPTIMDLCEIEYDNQYFTHGSLAPLWGPQPNTFIDRPVVSTGLLFNQEMESIIFGGLKYIRSLATDREELYDLISDPAEKNCIAETSPVMVQRARSLLSEHNEAAEKLREQFQIRPDETDLKIIKSMRSLGYL